MTRKKRVYKEAETCFGCLDNPTRCDITKTSPGNYKECRLTNECNGCKVCKTQKHEPCVHCEINCQYERTCFVRQDWISRCSKQVKFDISNGGNMNCSMCSYDYYCVRTNICPEDGEFSVEKIFKESDIPSNVSEMVISNRKNYQSHIVSYNRQEDDVWSTDINCITECPHKNKKLKIYIGLEAVMKILYLQKQFPSHEFTVYANTVIQDGKHTISDIVIPKQKVSFASVNDIEIDGNFNTVIHKHPGQTPGGFSNVDNEFANSNHDFSILIGNRDLKDVVGVGRIKTECERYMKVPLELEVMLPSVTDEKFLRDVSNIEKKEYPAVQSDKEAYSRWYNGKPVFAGY